jgi:hypothetical protein
MSENPETYKGKLPRPAKDQSIKEFEDEEIKPDPEYTEFNSVADILAKPEYFKLIIEQPEFQAMLMRENIPNPLKPAPEEAKQPKGASAEEKEKKPDNPAKSTEEEDEPQTSIDVVMVPSLEEVGGMEPQAAPDEPKVEKLFEPEYRRIVHPLTAPVELDSSHDLLTFKQSGLDDLMTKYSGDRKTKRGAKLFEWLQQYRPMGVISPIKYDAETGMVSTDNHAFMFGDDLAGKSASTHKYELSRIRPKVRMPSVRAREDMIQDPNTPDAYVNAVNLDEVVDMSYEPRPANLDLKSADVLMNPWRVPLLLRDIKAYKAFSLSYTEWTATYRNIINQNVLKLIRNRNAKERDVVNPTQLKKTLYDRFVVAGNGNSSQAYYYETIPNDERRDSELCLSVLNRSLARANESMSTIAPSQRSISSNITNRQASQMLLNLTAIQPSDAANFTRHLGTFLLGGYRRQLEVDVDAGSTKTPLLNALCSFAYLAVVDRRFLDDRSYRQLLLNVLLPFYDEFSVVRQNANGNAAPSPNVHQVADRVMAENFDLPPISKYMDLEGRGTIKRRQIRAILVNLLERTKNREFTQMDPDSRVYLTPAPAAFVPFTARNDIVDVVLFGTRTDGDESRMHETAVYRPLAMQLSGMLEDYANLLGGLRQFDGLGLAMSEAIKTKTHLTKSMAIFNDVFVHGSAHTELLPATARFEPERAVDSVTLPFEGALSFLLYGVGSSEIEESNNSFIRFKQMSTPTMPSLYPVYLYFERSITQNAFVAFGDEMVITHHDMVVDACLDALSVYFVSLDPESKHRISYMLNDREVLRGGNMFDLPTTLTSTIYSDHAFDPTRGRNKPLSLPGSFINNEEIEAENAESNPYKSAIDVVDRTIDKLYIHFNPLAPIKFESYQSGTSLVYLAPEGALDADYVSLHRLIIESDYVDADELTIDQILNMARVWSRKNDVRIDGVIVEDIKTSFKFEEHRGLSDIITKTPTIKIDRNSRYLDTQFEVDEITVYYHKLTDRQGELSEEVLGREIDYLLSFMTHVGIRKQDVQKYIANFDHTNPMNPNVYKLIEMDGNRDRLADDSIANVSVKDGKGITYAGRLTLSTRESEELTFVKTLASKEIFGA